MGLLNQILQNDLILLFFTLTIGSLLGKIKISGVELSAAGGVLFVSLALGHFNFILPDGVSSFGFAFFIYTIGFGAGPRFFQTFRKNGIKYGAVSLVVVLIATVTAFLCANIFNLELLLLPGILAGALTSTSTLAAAYEIIQDPTMSVGYGITYPFGLIGLLLMIQFVPRLLKINLKKEASEQRVESEHEEENSSFQRRIFKVLNIGAVAVPMQELELRRLAGVGIVAIKHENKIELANANSVLNLYDHVLAEGSLAKLLELEEYLGPEVADDSMDQRSSYTTTRVVISRRQILNKSIAKLRIAPDLGVILTRIQRGGIDLPVSPDIKLERGDVVTIAGNDDRVKYATSIMGREERKIYETDIFTFSAGLLLGILIGMIKLPLINSSLGNAGGLLLMGIILGYLRNFGPFSGRVPIAARHLLQELGLLLFLAGVGSQAGRGLIEQILRSGPAIFITGALVTTLCLVSTLLFCRYVLKFDWNTTFGATTGGMTSTVALKIVTREADSTYAVLGYAGVYAFANILLTLLGHFIVQFAS